MIGTPFILLLLSSWVGQLDISHGEKWNEVQELSLQNQMNEDKMKKFDDRRQPYLIIRQTCRNQDVKRS